MSIPDQDNPETFILPIDETAQSNLTPTAPAAAPFSVLPHLVLIAVILLGLFSSIVIPKALTHPEHTDTEAKALVPLPELAAVTNSIDPYAEIDLTAYAAYVWDINTQRPLFEKNADEVLPLASITKLMTTLVSYELVEDSTIVTVSAQAAKQESGGFFMPGEQFKAKELADFALVTSYNSAAYTLADSVGRLLGDADPITQFVTAMNIKAAELGLNSLDFNNPTGLDLSASISGGYGSAAETSRLVEYIALNYPEILIPTIAPKTTLINRAGYTHTADNTNDIVSDIPNLLGSKTGYTDLAGGNLTIVFDAGLNRYIVITVLGSTRNDRFIDVQKLITATQHALKTTE